MTLAVTLAVTQAERRTEVRRTKLGRKFDGRKWDERPTKVGRTSDESWTDVRRKLDGRLTKVGRKSNERPTKVGRVKLSCHCDDGGRRHFLATLQRWPGTLQLTALLRRWLTTHCSLQRSCSVLAATRWTSQRCRDGQQHTRRRNVVAMTRNALDVAMLLRWPATRWTSQCCYDS